MTENEAIKQLQVGYLGDTEDLVQAKHIAIKALEKVQAFEAIGTIEEFKALKEKSVAKKQGGVEDIDSHLRLSKIGFLCCSKTNKAIRYPLISSTDLEYCPCCGQKLDWSE